MDLRLGSKRIKAIYKGDTPIPGLMVNDRLWHGSAGTIILSSGGSAAEVDKVYYSKTISDGETVLVSSGGKMYDPAVSCGGVVISSYFDMSFNSNSFSNMIITDSATIHSCTTANSLTIANNGYIGVHVSGRLSNTTVESGGVACILVDGVANTITISSGGSMIVSYGGSALNVTSMTGAEITVDSGGYITYA